MDLITEIVVTAQWIGSARAPDGELIVRTRSRWALLRAIDRTWGCPSISDLARRMRISRQAARELVMRAERGGDVRLLPDNPHDRRILQVELTPSGRAALAASRYAEARWLNALLNGLADKEMAATTRVLRVIRHRLMRQERELSRARPGQA